MTRQQAVKPDVSSPGRSSWRETVESIVVAFVLAFLFRTFEAEAFVIPTGSMAPTLLGRHKSVYCPQCGERYSVGASEEEPEGNRRIDIPVYVVRSVCPNCHYVCDLARADMTKSYTGDRILVQKFPYELPGDLGKPHRWDVFVFRYPIEAQTNYIKRLIGLPNEQIKIHYGDIYVRTRMDGPFEIQRKPLDKQQALEMVVFNNDHLPKAQAWKAAWTRWRPDAEAGWTLRDEGRSFEFKTAGGAEAGWQALAYHHLVPTPNDWEDLAHGRQPRGLYEDVAMVRRKVQEWDRNGDHRIAAAEFPGPLEDFRRSDRNGDGALDEDELAAYLRQPRPQLITDFYAYDTAYTIQTRSPDEYEPVSAQSGQIPANWVGDLTLRCTAELPEARGGLRLELNEGVDRFTCEFDLASGLCTLRRGSKTLAVTPGPVIRPGTHRVAFANVDQRLAVWVDQRPIFGAGVVYEPPQHRGPTREDLRPAIIALRGTSARLSGLVLNRDIYYTLTAYRPTSEGDPKEADFALADDAPGELPGSATLGDQIEEQRRQIEADPVSGWPEFLRDATRWEVMRHIPWRAWPADRPLGPDQFMAMGDNSPRSKDSRLWTQSDLSFGPPSPQVDRRLLVGRAWFVYWPDAPWLPPPQAQTAHFPLEPKLSRMKFIK